MNKNIVFDADVIARYDTAGPRYTSYPTAVQFQDAFTVSDYAAAVRESEADGPLKPLSLYVHIPFCDTVCFYCGCNKIVTKDRSRALPYLDALEREIALQADLFDNQRSVNQLHFGGGTPTFLSPEQMSSILTSLDHHFGLRHDDQGEYSIEIDPRAVDEDYVRALRKMGFNRMSVGVQDFHPAVQAAVNRIQSEAQTRHIIEVARSVGMRSVNIDLIYGLPHQSVQRFNNTLDRVLAMEPDRLSVFNYAHLPERFKPQRRIHAEDLPTASEKLSILQHTIDKLLDNGYVYIGMDHFARPEDELAVAQRNGTLYRNFQGYSTHADCDLVGLGLTSIGQVGDCFAQNHRELDKYLDGIEAGQIPIWRGVIRNADDRIRAEVIRQLICHFYLDISVLEKQFGIHFADYFANEMTRMQPLVEDGLVAHDASHIEVLPLGKLLVRNVCMLFDRYLRAEQPVAYSRVI